MALVIEDGSGKPDAESYATAAELSAYAANFGFDPPASEPAGEAVLRRAALQMNGMPWLGQRSVIGQALAWPRSGVVVDCQAISSSAIPAAIKAGQMALALETARLDTSPPSQTVGPVVEETVGPITVKYAAGGTKTAGIPPVQSASQFDAYLAHFGLFVVRA